MADTVDSRIQDLPAIDSLADGDLLVVAREGDNFYARKMTVAQLTGYIEEVAGPYLDGAQEAATQAVTAVGQIGTAVEDTQAAQDAAETAAAQAEAARDHYPIPEDGTWHVYNPKSGQYEDTGEPSTGTPGEQGTPGAKGEPGTSVQDIRQVSGTHAPGTTDTYEVVLTDGSTGGQFQVYNGEDGSGGTTEPLNLTGFQPDPDDPTGMTMTLQLTDEQYASVVSCQNDGTPIYIEGAFLVYPIGRTSESPDFSSVPTSPGGYYRLYVNLDSKLASFYPFIPLSVSAQDAGIFPSLDTPKQDTSSVYEYGFNNNMPIYVYYPSLVGGEKIILYPDSHPTSTTYVFSNSTYHLTFDTSASTATLSLIDTVTEAYVTNAINAAIGNALEASY